MVYNSFRVTKNIIAVALVYRYITAAGIKAAAEIHPFYCCQDDSNIRQFIVISVQVIRNKIL